MPYRTTEESKSDTPGSGVVGSSVVGASVVGSWQSEMLSDPAGAILSMLYLIIFRLSLDF